MEENQQFPIKKAPVILTIIFDFLTGGIYSASWFLIRRQGFNQISKSKKLGMAIPIICLIMFVLNLMFRQKKLNEAIASFRKALEYDKYDVESQRAIRMVMARGGK